MINIIQSESWYIEDSKKSLKALPLHFRKTYGWLAHSGRPGKDQPKLFPTRSSTRLPTTMKTSIPRGSTQTVPEFIYSQHNSSQQSSKLSSKEQIWNFWVLIKQTIRWQSNAFTKKRHSADQNKLSSRKMKLKGNRWWVSFPISAGFDTPISETHPVISEPVRAQTEVKAKYK